MKIYLDLLLLAALTIYVVDVSGFTQSWRSLIAGWLKVKELRPLSPFDCGQCMTWWVCAIYAVCAKCATLPVLTYCAALSLLSVPIGQLMHAIRELLAAAVRIIFSICTPKKK